MPIPTGGLVQITLKSKYGSNFMSNVFYYWNQLNIEPISFIGMVLDWDTNIMADLADVTNEIVTFESITARTIFGILPDFSAIPSEVDGDIIGDASTSNQAFGYLYSPGTKEVNPGGKRFGGVTEDRTVNNGWDVTYFGLLVAFGANQLLSITDGINTYDAVIASRPKPTRATWAVSDIVAATPYSTVRHQVSRTPPAS